MCGVRHLLLRKAAEGQKNDGLVSIAMFQRTLGLHTVRAFSQFWTVVRDDRFQRCSSSHWRRKLFKRDILLFRKQQVAFMHVGKTKTCNVFLF